MCLNSFSMQVFESLKDYILFLYILNFESYNVIKHFG